MEKAEFQDQLIRGCKRVRTFSETFLLEPLPTDFRFRVKLNSSHDGHPHPDDITLYPQDSFEELIIRNRFLTVGDVANLLWRAGKVPVWIDVSVVSLTATHTVIELSAAGRFTANEDYLYYSEGDRKSPFGLKGPTLPSSYNDKTQDRFSIYHRASCWTLDEYHAMGSRKTLVRFLELGGPDFDDTFLSRLEEFPNLKVLELKCVPVRGDGLIGLDGMQNLQFLRISKCPNGLFSLGALKELPRLEELTVCGLATPPSDMAALTAIAPSLKDLTLEIESIDDGLSIPVLTNLERLRISAGGISGDVCICELGRLESLSLDGPFTDENICRMLEKMLSVASLHLSGTQASVGVIDVIRIHPKIEYVNLSKTLIDAETIRSLINARPEVRIHHTS